MGLSALLLQLLEGLGGQSGIALHDMSGDLLIARPGCVLDQDPAVLLRHPVRQADRVIIVILGDLRLGALGADVLQPLRRAPLGHVDHRLLAQQPGRPGHSAAVVSVGGSDEGDVPQRPAGGGGAQLLKAHLLQGLPQLFRQTPGHGIAPAQRLEGVEAEPLGLILDPDLGHAQTVGQAVQGYQRSGGIARQAAVEAAGLLRLPGTGQGQVGPGTLPPRAQDRCKVFHAIHSCSISFPAYPQGAGLPSFSLYSARNASKRPSSRACRMRAISSL